MTKKQMTYAEHQYRKAYSILREANHTQVGCDHYLYLHELLDFEIEESYVGKAIKTASIKTHRQRSGLVFWTVVWFRAYHEQHNQKLARKIDVHIEQHYIPF